jgi:hypothetical protein
LTDVVGRELDSDSVADENADAVSADATGAVGHDLMPVAQVYFVQIAVGRGGDDAITLDQIVFASYGFPSFCCCE